MRRELLLVQEMIDAAVRSRDVIDDLPVLIEQVTAVRTELEQSADSPNEVEKA